MRQAARGLQAMAGAEIGIPAFRQGTAASVQFWAEPTWAEPTWAEPHLGKAKTEQPIDPQNNLDEI
jgi:hypothetical protein